MNSVEEKEKALIRALEFEEEEKVKVYSADSAAKDLMRQHPLYKEALGFFQSPQGKKAIKNAKYPGELFID